MWFPLPRVPGVYPGARWEERVHMLKSLRKPGYWWDGREILVVRTPPKTPKGIGPRGQWEPTAKASGKRRAKGPRLHAGEKLPELVALDGIASAPRSGPKVKRNAERHPPKARVEVKGRGPMRKSGKVWRSEACDNAHPWR